MSDETLQHPYLPQQKHQQSQNQNACKNRNQYDPPGNSTVLRDCTLWGHCHRHLWNKTSEQRTTKRRGETGSGY